MDPDQGSGRARSNASFSDSIEEINPYATATNDDVEMRPPGGSSSRDHRSSFKKMSSLFKKSEPKDTTTDDAGPTTSGTSGGGGGGGGESSSFWGKGMGRMKGLFKKESKDDDVQPYATSRIEEPSATSAGYPTSTYSSSQKTTAPPSRMTTLRSSFRNLLHGKPPPPPPITKTDEDGLPVLELKQEPEKPTVRMSNILTVMLILLFITGVILSATGSLNNHCKILGPCFMVLSIFGLCGKAFFTLFWEDDPLPRVQPYWDKLMVYIGPVKDPYHHKTPPSYWQDPATQAQVYTYTTAAAPYPGAPGYDQPGYAQAGYATGVAQPEAYPMASFNYPQTTVAYPGAYPTSMYDPAGVSPGPSGMNTPVVYDPSLDTRPRAPSHQSYASTTERPPSRLSYSSGVAEQGGYINQAADTSNGLPTYT